MELCLKIPSPHPHLFGRRNANDLFPADRRIILLAAVAACDEHILLRVGYHQPVQPESYLALYQNNVSLAQLRPASTDFTCTISPSQIAGDMLAPRA